MNAVARRSAVAALLVAVDNITLDLDASGNYIDLYPVPARGQGLF